MAEVSCFVYLRVQEPIPSLSKRPDKKKAESKICKDSTREQEACQITVSARPDNGWYRILKVAGKKKKNTW